MTKKKKKKIADAEIQRAVGTGVGPKNPGRWAQRVALVFVSILAAMALFEVSLRIFPPVNFARILNSEQMFLADDLLGIRLRPDLSGYYISEGGGTYHVETNSHGLRDLPWNGADGRQVILGLGDSFLFGEGISREDIMLTILQTMLNKQFPNKFRTINAGIPGYATNQEAVYYAVRGKPLFDPSLVVVFFYINDVTLGGMSKDNTHFWYDIPLPNPDPDLLPQNPLTRGPDFRLLKFFRYLKRLRPAPETPALGAAERLIRPASLPDQAARQGQVDMGTEPTMFFRDHASTRSSLLKNNVGVLLQMLNRAVCGSGKKLLVVYLPSAREVGEGVARKDYADAYPFPESQWDWDGPNREFERIVRNLDIPLINLVPAFREHWRSTQQSLYFNGRGHFTPEGHSLAAQAIYPGLIRLLNVHGQN